jgi:hypothetical protein
MASLNLLDPNFSDHFQHLPPDGQQRYIDTLKEYTERAEASKKKDLAKFGVPEAKKKESDQAVLAKEVANGLDACR